MRTGRFDRIDILVNNAALRREKPFAEMDYAEWRENLDVTLDGAFTAPRLPSGAGESGAGTIVNIGGLSAHTGAGNRATSSRPRLASSGLTARWPNDLAADGITVNCVVPGLIGTPRPKGQPEPAHHLTHQTVPASAAGPRMSQPWSASCAALPRAT